jgi:glycosyltransferase involved in cell wall biosynthesis
MDMFDRVQDLQENSFSSKDKPIPNVLVIIPAYNEEDCIAYVVDRIKQSATYADILVINDGSTDNTACVARYHHASVLNMPHNLGIGGAVRAGFALAEELGYEIVIRLDGDGQHDPDDILRLLTPVLKGRVDATFGSRFCGDLNTYYPPLIRRFGIWLYGLVVSIIIHQRIHDATSGMWCVNRKAIRYFRRHFPQDYPEVESHIVLHKAGLSQMELPVGMHDRFGGQSSISPLRSVYYAFKVLLAVFVRAIQEVPPLPEEDIFALKSANYGYLSKRNTVDSRPITSY